MALVACPLRNGLKRRLLIRWYKRKGITSSILLLLSTLSTSKLLPLESSSTNGSRARFIPTLVVSSTLELLPPRTLRNAVRLGGRLRYCLRSSSCSAVRLGGRLRCRLRGVVVACSTAPLRCPLRGISCSNVCLSPRLCYRPRIGTDCCKVATCIVN